MLRKDMSEQELKRDAFAFLDGCYEDVENFPRKVSRGEFLRVACISHLRNWGYNKAEAAKVLDEWIWWQG
jgi:hypothetical protein